MENRWICDVIITTFLNIINVIVHRVKIEQFVDMNKRKKLLTDKLLTYYKTDTTLMGPFWDGGGGGGGLRFCAYDVPILIWSTKFKYKIKEHLNFFLYIYVCAFQCINHKYTEWSFADSSHTCICVPKILTKTTHQLSYKESITCWMNRTSIKHRIMKD